LLVPELSGNSVGSSFREFGVYKMASHGKTEYGVAKGNDYAEHESTYNLFLFMLKWGIILNVIIVFLMFWFLT
jgi:hypothetical protein